MRITAAIIGATLCVGATAAPAKEPKQSPAAAASDATPRRGAMLRTADGKRIGSINSIDRAMGDRPATANVILDGRLVRVPVDTITAKSDREYVTSMSMADVLKS